MEGGGVAAPGWFDGPRPDNFVSYGPGIVDGAIRARPQASDIALVIEVSSSARRKDEAHAIGDEGFSYARPREQTH